MIIRELATLLNFRVDQRGANQYEQRLDALANRASQIAAGIGAALTAAFGIDKIIEAGDAYTTSMNRLGASTPSVEAATQAFEGLYASARETGIAVEESSKSFMRFSPAMTKAGFSMEETIGLVDGLQKGLLAAGATAAESSAVFQQLGQAINSGVFQGEELGSFLENASPTLVARFAEALGTTSDKLKEMGSEGKLTTKNVLPALLEAAKAGRDEFGKMQVTVGLATARARVAMDRFLAEFERAFRFTQSLGRLIGDVGNRFDEWRRYIPTIRAAVDELGGMERIMATLAIGTAYLTTLFAAMNGTLTALLVRVGLLSAQLLAVVAAGLLLQDFFTWLSGSDTKTIFGEMFGPARDIIGPYKPLLDGLHEQIKNVKDILVGTPDEAIAAWDRLKDYLKRFWNDAISEWPDFLKSRLGFQIGEAPAAGQGSDAQPGFFGRGRAALTEAYGRDDDAPILNWLGEEIRRGLGAIGFRQQVEGEDGKLRLLQPGETMNDALLRRPSSTTNSNVTVNQNNTNNIHTTVNATGTSGAEIAGAAERGVSAGASDVRLDADRLAREVRMAIPGLEGAGGTAGATP